jgi:hypothetical protein
MTAHERGRVADGFGGNGFDRDGDAFRLTTTAFGARVAIDDDGSTSGGDGPATDDGSGPTRYRLTVRVPTLDAAAEEAVAEPVAEGWFETLTLRLEDAPDVTRTDVDVAEPTVGRTGEEVVVGFAVEHSSPKRAAAAAKALAEYVEGTYVEGVVPGYTYGPPVAGLLSRARGRGDGSSDVDGDGERGAMPL